MNRVAKCVDDDLVLAQVKKDAPLDFIFLNCVRSAQKIVAMGIAKPSPRIGLVYLGKR